MLAQYHREMTQAALEHRFSPDALKTIVQANLYQDSLKYLLGSHPHYHFDDSAFDHTRAYLDEQRQLILEALHNANPCPAREAFGRITHALQDFYSHSNYVHLWLERNGVAQNPWAAVVNRPNILPGELYPDPARIEPLISDILASPRLFTARSALFFEILGMIPVLGKMLIPYFPPDTHVRMNLDQPSTGPLFPFAISAGRKRTESEFEALSAKILDEINPKALAQFTGNLSPEERIL